MICLKCLQKEPRRRYAGARELAEDLQRFRAGLPIRARPISRLERLWRACRRNPRMAAVCAALVLVVLLGFVGVTLMWLLADQRRQVAAGALEREEVARAQRYQELARLHTLTGNRLLEEGDFFSALPWYVEARRVDELGRALTPDEAEQHRQMHRLRLGGLLSYCPRLLQIWFHPGPVRDVSFSPSGGHVVLAGEDGTARVYDTGTGAPVGPALGPTEPHNRAIVREGGGEVLVLSKYLRLFRWDGVHGQPLPIPAFPVINNVDLPLSADHRLALLIPQQGHTQVWDLAANRAIGPVLPFGEGIAAFSPDNRRLVTTGKGLREVWNVASGKRLGQFPEPHGHPKQLTCHPHKRWVMAVWSRTVEVHEMQSGQALFPALVHPAEVVRAAFSPDGTRVATAGADGMAQVWELSTGRRLGPPLVHPARVNGVEFSPDNSRVVTASNDRTARVWEAATGRPLTPPLLHCGAVYRATFHPDGSRVLTASSDGTARLWDVTMNRYAPQLLQHYGAVYHAAFNRDGQLVATASADHTARVWDGHNGKALGLPLRHAGVVNCVSFHPLDDRLLTGGGTEIPGRPGIIGVVRTWDGRAGQPAGPQLTQHHGPTRQVAWSPDGNRLLLRAELTVNVFDLTHHKDTAVVGHDYEMYHGAFSVDGRWIVTVGKNKSPGDARIWEADTGKKILGETGTDVRHAALSPDGRQLLTASSQGTAQLWEVPSGRLAGPGLRHDGAVVHVAFSSDGQRLATASEDGTARIWQTSTGKQLGEPLRHEGRVVRVAFHPDGRLLLSVAEVTRGGAPRGGLACGTHGPRSRSLRRCGTEVPSPPPTSARTERACSRRRRTAKPVSG